jgi:tRNA-2-methylthio-N6-dimethylallyladenosine synthase
MNTCSVREKAQEKVFSELGRWKPLKQSRPDLDHRRRWLRRQPGGPKPCRSAPPMSTSCSARRPCTACRRLLDRVRREQQLAIDVSFPEIEKFDALPEPRAEGPKRVRVDHGGLQQVLHVLRRALYPRRGDQRPLDDVIAELALLAEQGVREVVLLGQNVNAYRGLITRARSPISPNCCITWPPSTASSASATPPRIRSSSATA